MCGGGRRRRFHAVQRPDDRPARARTPPPRPAPRAQPAGRGPGKSRIKSPVSTPQALVQGSSSHRADTVTAAPARLHARRASAAARRRRRHQTPRLGTHNTQSQSSLTVNTPFERHPIPRTHATKHLFSATWDISRLEPDPMIIQISPPRALTRQMLSPPACPGGGRAHGQQLHGMRPDRAPEQLSSEPRAAVAA